MEKVASLEELDRYWTLEDVLKANIALDAVAEAERQMHEQQRAKQRG